MTSHLSIIYPKQIFTTTLLICIFGLGPQPVRKVMAQDNVAPPAEGPFSHTQQAQLTANDGTMNDNFGNAVAISGNTAVVGAYRQPSQNNRGAAYVFDRSGATWSQQQKLLPADIINGETFGASVAIDGDTIVVSAPIHRVGAVNGQGAVYVFVRNGTNWILQQQLAAAISCNRAIPSPSRSCSRRSAGGSRFWSSEAM